MTIIRHADRAEALPPLPKLGCDDSFSKGGATEGRREGENKMASGPLTGEQVSEYHDKGYTLARGMFDEEEIGLLRRAAKEDRELDAHSFGRDDGEGKIARLSLWNHPGDTLYGMFARCESIVRSAEKLLGGEVYHYHSKMIMKDAKVGGAWTWHQDYGYWYQNGVLFPLLCSASIAVDRATRENGCLQVVQGSHAIGRIDHVLTGEQAGADWERVQAILERLPLVYAEMEAGDVLFFHSNLLHRSEGNASEHPRWSMICCYNAARNDPYKDSHHPRYTPLHVVSDSAIREAGLRRFADSNADVAWLDSAKDQSARALKRPG
jgi:ectoine hydroxylase